MNTNASSKNFQSISIILLLLLCSSALSLKLQSTAVESKVIAKMDKNKLEDTFDFETMDLNAKVDAVVKIIINPDLRAKINVNIFSGTIPIIGCNPKYELSTYTRAPLCKT